MKKLFIVTTLATVALTGAAREVWWRDVEHVMGSATPMRVIREADSVRVWRVVERKGQVAPGELGSIKDTTEVQVEDEALMLRVRFSPVGEGAILSNEQSSKLKALVLAPTSYAANLDDGTGEVLVSGTKFYPLIRIRFSHGETAVETWVSFSWAHMLVLDEKRVLGGSMINPMRQELLALLKSALEGDAVIAKLK